MYSFQTIRELKILLATEFLVWSFYLIENEADNDIIRGYKTLAEAMLREWWKKE